MKFARGGAFTQTVSWITNFHQILWSMYALEDGLLQTRIRSASEASVLQKTENLGIFPKCVTPPPREILSRNPWPSQLGKSEILKKLHADHGNVHVE